MNTEIGTFDSPQSKTLTFDTLSRIFKDQGVESVFIKKLAANDNSKNQPYAGGHLSELSFIPTGELVGSKTESKKNSDPKRQIKYQAGINYIWLDASGNKYPAPHAKLIYYPQYPEVRLSGFLKGSKAKASRWMDRYKEGTAEGRWLLLGSNSDSAVFAYLVTPECNLSQELESINSVDIGSVFRQISLISTTEVTSTRGALIEKLLEIHHAGWISSRKLNPDMSISPYTAQNGGGYTLEAELGVVPNGIAEPDFLGWEIKQFGVTKFPRTGAKPTTLFTPEPDGGFYVDEGASEFVRKYGYPDKSGKPNRLNFGGKHVHSTKHQLTNLTLELIGFDIKSSSITDPTGAIALIAPDQKIAASWSYAKLMGHWKKKHSQAAYIPCLKRKTESGLIEYHYGKDIELATGTNFENILSAISNQIVFYDPGIKLEGTNTATPKLKRRSQFRISHNKLAELYSNYEEVDILG